MTICKTTAVAAKSVADRIAAAVAAKPNVVLGLATGGTMEPVYKALVRRSAAGLSFSAVRVFALDEYVGLPPDHPQSYRVYLRERFVDHVGLDPSRFHVPRGDLSAEVAASEYETTLRQHGPVDLQLLGIGRNGHIGFNEPGSPFASRTRLVALTASTRAANARFFAPGHVPRHAITMGIASILEARRLLVFAIGPEKSDAVWAMVMQPPTVDVPASAVRLHASAEIVLDEGAAGQVA